jgi:hypothetical protein
VAQQLQLNLKKLNMKAVSFLKSKIVWVQIVATLALLFEQYGMMGFINAQIAMFVSFALTAILQKFASSQPISITGISQDGTMFWTNLIAAGLMITDYFLENQIFNAFGVSANVIGMLVISINLVLRTYFVNQPSKEVMESGK